MASPGRIFPAPWRNWSPPSKKSRPAGEIALSICCDSPFCLCSSCPEKPCLMSALFYSIPPRAIACGMKSSPKSKMNPSGNIWQNDFATYRKEDLSPPKHKLSKLLLAGNVGLMLSQPVNRFPFRSFKDQGNIVYGESGCHRP